MNKFNDERRRTGIALHACMQRNEIDPKGPCHTHTYIYVYIYMILVSSLCEPWQGGDVNNGFRIWCCSNRRGCALPVGACTFHVCIEWRSQTYWWGLVDYYTRLFFLCSLTLCGKWSLLALRAWMCFNQFGAGDIGKAMAKPWPHQTSKNLSHRLPRL